jgi:hypothetical protein
VFYALPAIHPAFTFPLLAPFLLLGLAGLRAAPRPVAALLGGWAATVWAFLAGIAWENPRFSLALLPSILVVVGLGVESALRGGRLRRTAAAVCAVSLAGMAAWSARDLAKFTAAKDESVAVSRWAAARVPAGAVLLSFGLTNTIGYYTAIPAVELYDQTAATLTGQACGPRPAYLLLNEGEVEAQWRGLAPHVNFQWLRDHAGLVEVGRRGPYVLWRLGDRCRGGGPPGAASGP